MRLGNRSIESRATETTRLVQITQRQCAPLYGLQDVRVLPNEDLRFLEQSAPRVTWANAFEWFVRRFRRSKTHCDEKRVFSVQLQLEK